MASKWALVIAVLLPLASAERLAARAASNMTSNANSMAMWEMIAGSGAKYTDVSQGELGTCYFLASIASIANMRPDLIQKMFVADAETEATSRNPVWQVQFLLNGYPTVIAVDDKVPTSQGGKPFFVSWNDGDQVWPLILEKAWAKIFGSFKGVEGGGIAEVFKAITQAPVVEIDHQRVQQSDYQERKENLWDNMYQATQSKYPMGSATDVANPGGLAAGHAYAILGVIDDLAKVGFYMQGDKRGVHVYNPWASNIYSGVLKGQSKEQGGFYMPFEEFLLSFRCTTIAKTRQGYSLSHQTFTVPQPSAGEATELAKTVSFSIKERGPVSVQFEWPSRRFLPECPEDSPTAVMIVYKDASPYSEMQFAEKSNIWMTNIRADVEGPGNFKVYIHTHLEKKSWLQKVTVNVHAKEKVNIAEVRQSDAHALFLSSQNLCPEIETQHGIFQTRQTFKGNGLPYYENMDRYSQLRFMFFSPMRVLIVPGGVKSVGSNQWHTIDDLDKAISDPDVAFVGIGNLGDATNNVKIDGCREINSHSSASGKQFYAPYSATQPSSYMSSASFAKKDNCEDGVVKPYMFSTYRPTAHKSVEECRALLNKFEDGSLNNINDIKSLKRDPKFPPTMQSIAEPGTDCGDKARGYKELCDKYDHWSSIMNMFGGRVADGRGKKSDSGPSRLPARPVRYDPQPKPQPKPLPPANDYPSCFQAIGTPNQCHVVNRCANNFGAAQKVRIHCQTASGTMRIIFPNMDYTYINQGQPWCSPGCSFLGYL